jgi:predicted nucleic acid-binding protein
MTRSTCGFRCRSDLSWNDLDDFDLILAACALAHDLVLVTNNVKHLQRIQGLKFENWAKA